MMSPEKKRSVIWLLVFFAIAVLLIVGLDVLFKPKWSTGFKSGSNIRGFYEMPRDSVDVLVLGSSNVICGVNANEMFEKNGISGWTCGTEAQPLFGSLAWLQEAQRYQTLSAVVLDVGDLFEDFDEVSYRKTFDYMRLSPLKICMLEKLKKNHPEIDLFSFILPFVQYHSRWRELSTEDFFYRDVFLKGFFIRTEIRGTPIAGIDEKTVTERAVPQENLDSLLEIIRICRENDIKLILISCPSARVTAQEHNAVERISEENGLVFLDFNEVSKWPDINYSQDMADFQHFNVFGARKATMYILEALNSQADLPDRSDSDLQIRLSEEYRSELERIAGSAVLFD